MLPHTFSGIIFSLEDYLKYFENIAYQNLEINHSENVRKYFNRVDDIMGTGLKYPLMCVMSRGTRMEGGRDAMFEIFYFNIWVVKSLGQGSPEAAKKIINECKLICNDIIARLEEDSSPGGSGPYKYFSKSETTTEPLDDPMFGDKLIGWSIDIGIASQQPFNYDSAKWR